MTAGGAAPKLAAALTECDLHAQVLAQALAEVQAWLPFDAIAVARIDPVQRRLLDQIAYRFGKLQDRLPPQERGVVVSLVMRRLSEHTREGPSANLVAVSVLVSRIHPRKLSSGGYSSNSPPAACGGVTPKCRYAASVAIRPRGVRCKKPCMMR